MLTAINIPFSNKIERDWSDWWQNVPRKDAIPEVRPAVGRIADHENRPQLTNRTPHPEQAKVIQQSKRFNVVCCGPRWGKTVLGMDRLMADAPTFPL